MSPKPAKSSVEQEAGSQKPKRGCWKPGESGNPAGRRKGSSRANLLRETLGPDRLTAIIGVLADKAMGGDTTAAKILLDRTLPPLKPVEPPLEPLAVPEQGNILASAERVMQAVLQGALPPSQAAAIMAGLTGLARVREVEELEQRLQALEQLETPR
ncbi:DUF5681 domain-containing protein [Crenobacter caeni]|uniref:DUF5681 domain-containing protein n=1 Tax=Crenobacter caeni TaxID=2705474 RepID=A0A6B2KTH5_9NEIS|nr:DUF5681 domain-containing protein [Crenobacter caeni]NDV13545.1 hypothetical protein [Crenobacter caeni]